jgi:beta-lactam-binding protein with PASTA domain
MRLRIAACVTAAFLVTGACGTPSTNTPSTDTTTSAHQGSGAQTSANKERVVVPDVSGMNHQQAQDAMQAAGLYNLREVDGKGLGRLLVIDKNWVQTGQSPAAGATVDPDTVVTLTAVKYDDR